MAENILDVRLLHAAKPLNSIYDTSTTPPTLVTQGWSDVVTPPKKGEVCLEIQGTNPPLSYKIKIGDGTSSYLTLPYFGTTVNVGQSTSIVRIVNTDPVEGTPIPPELWFYKIALDKSDVAGVTTITPVIGDLYLKVKEGDKIDFDYKTEELTIPELTLNHETVTATTDAVTITDGGTFTAATTKDNYGHVTKLTTFTLPSIGTAVTEAIEALDKTNFDLVEWDSTNGILTMYPIYETDGVIYKGSTASYTLDLSTYVGNVVHDVKINNTSILDSNNEANLAVDGTYNASTNKIATESTVSDAIDTAIGALDAATVGGTDKVITTVSETDGVISATAVNKTDIAPVQGVTTTDTGDSGIEITTSNNIKDVHHKTVVQDNTDTSSIIGEKELPVITGVSVDSYGHITGVTKDVSSNLIAADIKAPVKQTDNSTWNHRVTGGDISIGEDTAKIPVLKGNTIVWNQLMFAAFSTEGLAGELTATDNQDGSIIINGTTTSNRYIVCECVGNTISNTHIIVYGIGKGDERINFTDGYAVDNWGKRFAMSTLYRGGKYLYIYIKGGETFTNVVIYPQLFDLTQMFGSGNEPATVEAFEKLFPNDYYEYNEGELISLFDNSKSFNVWDEEWEVGTISGSDGENVDSSTAIRSSNYISVIPNTNYYGDSRIAVMLYDVNKTFLSYITTTSFTTPSNCFYIRFATTYSSSYGANYNHDICINISNPEYNGLYLPYGEPLPFGVKSVGFNQWDEEWEVGAYDDSGNKILNNNTIRSKNAISVIPNTDYYADNQKIARIMGYTISGECIGRIINTQLIVRIPTNCAFIRFNTNVAYGSTYNHDICINISDPAKNGTYEPHKQDTLDLSWIKDIKDSNDNQLFPNGLLSAGSVYDEVTESKAIKRIGSVDLGSLEWDDLSTPSDHVFRTTTSSFPNAPKPVTGPELPNAVNNYYKIVTWTSLGTSDNMCLGYATNANRLSLINFNYTDAATFKTAMSGVMLYYELATPIEVDIVPKKNMSYLVNDLGTETQLPVNPSTTTPITAPFVGTFEYKSNFKDTVIDLIDKVNNAANPVKGINNTDQTVGKIAVYDSERTTHSSNYSASNATIVEGATGNDIILPAIETIVNYVNSKLSSALTYKGTISEWADLPTSGQSTGDMYIADTTFTEGGVTYQAGDFFIWNGTDWDIVSGTTSVVNSNPTLNLDGGTYQVGTVDGIALQVTTPDLDYSSPTASGTSLEYIDSVSQSNGLISATKKSLPNASTTQAGVTSFVTDVHYSTDNEKTATAKQIWVECEKRNVQFVEAGVVPTGLPMSEEDFINTYAYGVKWVQGGSECTRVGNSSLHETMPIHNALRACVYQIVPQEVTVTETIDGVDYTLNYGAKREFRYWLDDDDWNKKADGTPSVLTGEDMTGIAIWHPKFYGKSFDGVVDGSTSYNSVYVSLVQYDNTWTEIKEGYVDFAKMQTVSSNGVNYARSFGNPDFSVDNPSTTEMTLSAINTWIQTQKDSTQSLVKSQVSLNRLTANQYAMNAGAHLMSLDEYKWIFCWLPVIECAAFTVEENTHFDWQDGSDTNVVMRDSLGNVPSWMYPNWMYYGMYSANYSAITGTCGWTFVPAGYTNKLGTHTGWIKMRLPNSGGTYDSKIASRWRGFEIQRNIWTNLMGVNPVQTNTSGTVDVYSTKNRALWNNDMPIDITDESASTHANIMPWDSRDAEEPEYTTLTGWEHKGIQKWNGYGTEFDLGSDGNPTYRTLGSSKPDYHYGVMSNANPRWFIAVGAADNTSSGGPFYFTSDVPAGGVTGFVGFRCCWNIDEYNSVLN